MATLTDVFSPDGFSVYSLTAAINKLPYAESILGSMGIFRNIPVATTQVAVEEMEGKLTLVPTTKRGGPGIPSQDPKRKIRSLVVPHIQIEDTVDADEVINVRSFGSQDAASGAAEVVARKLAVMRGSVEATLEYLRVGSALGVVTYPTNSVDSALSLFTVFGTSQATVNWALGTDTTDVRGLVQAALRTTRSALGGSIPTGIVVLCGEAFMDTLVNHPNVKTYYNMVSQQMALAAASRVGFGTYRRQFTFDGVVFIEYPATQLGVAHIDTAHAVLLPLGVDAFQSYIAPADIPEAAGTVGQEFYARQYLSPDGKRIMLEVQSNVLPICTRPRALLYITKT
jgi:hypothetical protein